MGRNTEKVELRGQIDKAVIDVLDACSMARGMDRIALVEKVLADWAARKVNESTLLHRVARGNPAVAELGGMRLDADGG